MPRLLFKYKAMTSAEDIIRVIDILKNHRLYFPVASQLNDPLEGVIRMESSGFAGISIFRNIDEEYPHETGYREKFQILSFSRNCFSPQMWAYYCHEYNGMCLCYKGSNTFSTAQEVEYTSEEYEPDPFVDPRLVFESYEQAFMKKQIEWKHEQEWRIVKNRNKKAIYLNYQANELVGVILGHKLNNEYSKLIQSIVPAHVQLMITHPGYRTRRIGILPYDYKIQCDGSPQPYIYDLEDMEEYLLSGISRDEAIQKLIDKKR